VTNRCELVCLDTQGKLIWTFDMIKELGVVPHNKTASSPASYGGLVFAGTSNGRDENHTRVPRRKRPL